MALDRLVRTVPVHDRILPHHYFQAARWAVLTPFDSSVAKRGKFHVPKVYHALWEKWVDLVVRMSKEVGWPDKANPLWVANCPYFGVKGHTRQPCNKDRICPFCWARTQVIRPYCHVDALLPKGKIQRAGHSLVEFSNLERILYIRQGNLGGYVEDQPLDRLIEIVRTKIKHDVRPAMRLAEYEGAYLHYSLDLHPVAKMPGYFKLYFRRSGLMLLRKDRDLTRAPGTTYRDEMPVDQPSLMRAFSRICRYPAGWLLHGTAEQVKQYLDGFAGCHLSRYYGTWSGNHNSEIGKEAT